MQALLAPLKELAEYEEIYKKRGAAPGMLLIANCSGSQKTHLMYSLSDSFSYKLIVLSSAEKANSLYEEYRFLSDSVYLYPAKDMLFYHADIKGKYLLQQRMETVRMLMENPRKDLTVVTTIDGFMDGLCSVEALKKKILRIESGQVLDFETVTKALTEAGYEREIQVDSPGQFAVRGGILDVYPLTEELPVRIELWGDEVDSIRSFDAESQRSVENLQEITLSYQNRLVIKLGTGNNLPYKLQLTGVIVRNDDGNCLSDSDRGTLDVSYVKKDGTIEPVFRSENDIDITAAISADSQTQEGEENTEDAEGTTAPTE